MRDPTYLDHDAWYDSPPGAFALGREKLLLQKVLSVWPRRGHSLLEVGCGTGRFLEFFWECGFDVSGLDHSETLLRTARQRLGRRADLQLGAMDHLPFEDNSFDYVALINILEYLEDPADALSEALRVAANGVLLGFLNRWSLSCLRRSRLPGSARWRSWWQYYSLARSLRPDSELTVRTTLSGPPCTWRDTPLGRWCNSFPRVVPLGCFGVLRMDLCAMTPRTPLALRLNEVRMKAPTPAVECGQERCTD